MNRDGYFSGLSIQLLPQAIREHPSTQIRRRRLDANLGYHDSTAGLGRLFVLLDHCANPGDFAGYVKVVSSLLGTIPEHNFTILTVWTNSSQQNKRLGSEIFDLLGIAYVGNLDR